jgi:hypothetical protein
MAYYTFSHLTTPDCSYPKCVATTVPLSRLQHHANWDITNQRAIFKKRVKYLLHFRSSPYHYERTVAQYHCSGW